MSLSNALIENPNMKTQDMLPLLRVNDYLQISKKNDRTLVKPKNTEYIIFAPNGDKWINKGRWKLISNKKQKTKTQKVHYDNINKTYKRAIVLVCIILLNLQIEPYVLKVFKFSIFLKCC